VASPPKEVSAVDLWSMISEAPRPYEIVDYPRKQADGSAIKIAMLVLTVEEQLACSREAGKLARTLIKEKDVTPDSPDYVEIYRSQAAIEALFRACRKPHALNERTFPSAEDLRRNLTGDELDVLFRSYLQVKSMKGPIITEMSEEECDAWIERLQEAGSQLPLGLFSWDGLADLVMRLVSRQRKFSTDTSSAGGQQSAGAPETE
jgi:hypothetical protein